MARLYLRRGWQFSVRVRVGLPQARLEGPDGILLVRDEACVERHRLRAGVAVGRLVEPMAEGSEPAVHWGGVLLEFETRSHADGLRRSTNVQATLA